VLRAYFDTSVYSGLVEGRVPPEDEAALRRALAAGEITAPVSLVNIEELLGEAEADCRAMIRKLALMRSLGGFRGMLKQPRDILKDATEAYAAESGLPPIALPEPERRQVVFFLAHVVAGSARHDADLRRILDGVDGLKDRWLADMMEAQRLALGDPLTPAPRERWKVGFRDYFEASAPDLAERFAVHIGCEEGCRRRGLDGLVGVPAMRLYTGVMASQMYAQLVGTPGQPDLRRPHRNDGYDIWHAILASTADIFVTFDGRLADHIERIPGLDTFRVVRSVRELLAMLGSAR
jgi:hypothetical protein